MSAARAACVESGPSSELFDSGFNTFMEYIQLLFSFFYARVFAYFIFGKYDSVGVMSNLFPLFVALYNLYLDLQNRRRSATAP